MSISVGPIISYYVVHFAVIGFHKPMFIYYTAYVYFIISLLGYKVYMCVCIYIYIYIYLKKSPTQFSAEGQMELGIIFVLICRLTMIM